MAHRIYGKVIPIKEKILVKHIDKGERKTAGGLILPSSDEVADGGSGVRPRWAQVYAVGPKVDYLHEGQWVLMDHGRWTNAIELDDGNEVFDLRICDADGILGVQDEKPSGIVSVGIENPGHGPHTI
tara:strand:- start:1834 stop:2214 length:381 start_codon:yes stop_codon:yes gene_type:complete